MLDHRARRDLAHSFILERIFFDKEAKSRREHVLVAELVVGGIGAGEGDAGAAQDGDAS